MGTLWGPLRPSASLRSWSVEDKFEDGGERKDWNFLAHAHSHLPPGQFLVCSARSLCQFRFQWHLAPSSVPPNHAATSTTSVHAESGTRPSATALPPMQLALVDTPWMLVGKSATFSGKGNPAGLMPILDVRVREILV